MATQFSKNLIIYIKYEVYLLTIGCENIGVGGSYSIGGKIWVLPRSIGSGQFIPAMCFIHLFISSRKPPPPPLPQPPFSSRQGIKGPGHKVLTYIEYRAVSGVFRTIDPPPTPSPPSECVLPPHLRRGYTLAGRWGGGGGVNISEDARHWIGLLQYNPSTGK